ncbi:hypothetical protein [Cellulomonas phragmiteti]|uniref:Glycosyltransferase 2-like domain-containing protein n=1 Tax=Cellulomonas phragmiteti TaxID=478780 RepID=A0ABQ4DH25_9CELL|nr:hypothetical protein [Cellulomonas phragmiteti]GIG38656.1 hypothetical protein Cph01nite_04180 [Cellulomonas phragmiteti]
MNLRRLRSGDPVLPRALARLELELNPRLAPVRARRLHRLNQTSDRAVTGDAPVVVSLTTYGARFETVHLTVESIAQGRRRPRRLVLWLDDQRLLDAPTPGLQRLLARGLEIRMARNDGPHTKYFPLLSDPDLGAQDVVVTADDDVLYPRGWLAGLESAARRDPEVVHCYRAYRVRTRGDGTLAPYRTWRPSLSTEARFDNFATGVSGVAYPPRMIEVLRGAGTRFRECAPHADDVWLHAVAVESGVRVRQLTRQPRHFPVVPGSQASGLRNANVTGDGNDPQIAATYSADALQRLGAVDGVATG